MKKNNTTPRSWKRTARKAGPLTIGMDLGDKSSRYCVLEENGEVRADAASTCPVIACALNSPSLFAFPPFGLPYRRITDDLAFRLVAPWQEDAPRMRVY
jgi:hypothetical protein